MHGACVDLCPPGTCDVPKVCEWRTGACKDPQFPEAGLTAVPGGSGDDDLLFAGGAGITCNTHGLARASAGGALACALSFGLLLVRRSRRRRR